MSEMKVDELRRALQSHSENDLCAIITELYKNLPKAVRDNNGIDELITKPSDYFKKEKPTKTTKSVTLDAATEDEIREFLENAKARNYCIPNRVIHKSERPKWRFKAKNYYKLLITVSQTDLANDRSDNLQRAGELLESLYRIMCLGCRYQIFPGQDPFASAGIVQTEFLHQLLIVKAEILMPREFIDFSLDLISQGTDFNTSTRQLIRIFQKQLKIPDIRKMVIGECEKRILKELTPPPQDKKNKHDSWSYDYHRKSRINVLAEICFFCFVALGESDRGIEFYKKYHDESGDPELKLYYLLDLLRSVDEKDVWVCEYESAVKVGIQPRDSLQLVYAHIKEHGDLPKNANATWL